MKPKYEVEVRLRAKHEARRNPSSVPMHFPLKSNRVSHSLSDFVIEFHTHFSLSVPPCLCGLLFPYAYRVSRSDSQTTFPQVCGCAGLPGGTSWRQTGNCSCA